MQIITIITEQGDPFLKSDMLILANLAVVPANNVLKLRIKIILEGWHWVNLWPHIWLKKQPTSGILKKKNNGSYSKHVGATVKTEVSGQIVTHKQERALLSSFLVAAKSRTDFVIKEAIGDFKLWTHHLIFTQMDQWSCNLTKHK